MVNVSVSGFRVTKTQQTKADYENEYPAVYRTDRDAAIAWPVSFGHIIISEPNRNYPTFKGVKSMEVQ